LITAGQYYNGEREEQGNTTRMREIAGQLCQGEGEKQGNNSKVREKERAILPG
jgi:hypothetical protein